MADAGVVDHDVETPVPLHDRSEARTHLSLVSYVEGKRGGGAPLLDDAGGDAFGRVGIQIDDLDMRTLLGKEAGNRLADARASARDERDFAVETKHGVPFDNCLPSFGEDARGYGLSSAIFISVVRLARRRERLQMTHEMAC